MSTTPSFLDTLRREAGAAADTVTGLPGALKAAFTQPATYEENADFNGDTKGLKRVGLGIHRLLTEPVENAAKDYAHGRVGIDDALQYAPEALGAAGATVLGGKALDTALAGEHPQIASEALQEHAKTGGSTYEPTTGRNLAGSRKIAVGIAPEHAAMSDRPFTPQQYSEYVASHRDLLAQHPNVAVGTDFDPNTGLHRMELVGTTPSRSAASSLAHHLGEDHVYNLATDERIPTGIDPAAERPTSSLPVADRINQLNAQSPKKAPYSGTHYSDAQLDFIDGTRRGAPRANGVPSMESQRLRLGSQTGLGEDAPSGYFTYKSGSLPDTAIATRQNAYQVRGHMAFASTEDPVFQTGYSEGVQKATAAGADPQTAHHLGLNAAENAVQNAGFDGYFSPQHPSVRFHFGNGEIAPTGPRIAPDLAKWQPPPELGAFSDEADIGSKVRAKNAEPTRAEVRGARTKVRGAQENQDTAAFQQARKELGDGASSDDIVARAEQILGRPGAYSLKKGPENVLPNGSGESSASAEAINRAASDKARGIRYVKVDSRSGVEMPLIGPDALDVQPGPFDVVMQRTPHGDVELARGHHAR